ncbi:hypothetical protein V5799_010433 [Amblyomma americanum]|uniref:Uncharacterized protein n=1 Tax=Amblyomma americanum TaxID=6943 RepID=A0AAQ4EJP6_AMBAM
MGRIHKVVGHTNVYAFLSVPYAEEPVAELRFRRTRTKYGDGPASQTRVSGVEVLLGLMKDERAVATEFARMVITEEERFSNITAAAPDIFDALDLNYTIFKAAEEKYKKVLALESDAFVMDERQQGQYVITVAGASDRNHEAFGDRPEHCDLFKGIDI